LDQRIMTPVKMPAAAPAIFSNGVVDFALAIRR
jgi:hypothetical protein